MFYLEYNHTSQNSDIVDIRYDLLPSKETVHFLAQYKMFYV